MTHAVIFAIVRSTVFGYPDLSSSKKQRKSTQQNRTIWSGFLAFITGILFFIGLSFGQEYGEPTFGLELTFTNDRLVSEFNRGNDAPILQAQEE